MPGVKGRSGGRNAKTIEQHKLQGTFDPARHKGYRNPKPPAGIPKPPMPLEGVAMEEWRRMVARLTTMGILSSIDDGVLYQYCRMFAETEEIRERQTEAAGSVDILEENLGDLKGPDLVAAFQEIAKMRQLEARYSNQIRQGRMGLRIYLVEFGMTPAARSRVKIPDDNPKDPFAEFDGETVQ